MKYILLFLAALLVAFGGFAFAAGFHVVFDGEGSSLIAGVVGLGCGVIIAGQVFILRGLEAMRAALEGRGSVPVNDYGYNHEEAAFAASFPAAARTEPQPALAPAPHFFAEAAPQPAEVDFAAAPAEPVAPQMSPRPFDRISPAMRPVPAEASRGNGFLGKFGQTASQAQATSQTVRGEEPVAPEEALAARVDTDLLLEAALAVPAPAAPEPAAEPPPIRPAAFATNLRTSPSLTEMWRRVTAKSSKPAAAEQQDAPPPPIPAFEPAETEDHEEDEPSSRGSEAADVPAQIARPVESDLDPAVARAFSVAVNGQEEPRSEPDDASAEAVEALPPAQALAIEKAEREPAAAPAARKGLALGGWFDDALSGSRKPSPVQASPVQASPVQPSPLEASPLEATPSRAEPVVPVLRPVAEEEPRPAPAQDAPATTAAATEMGRYQANGTTYVMYSDGSIEAQTDQGIYRFGSMAELKTFFEEQVVAH
jgi:hypothetical protein